MADYPWGAQAPAKRVAAVEKQIRSNDKKKEAALAAHAEKMATFDEVDKGLKADLRQAQTVLDREEREQLKANASKTLEKSIDKLIAKGIDVEAAIESGELAKMIENFALENKKPAASETAKPKKTAKADDAGASGES